MRTVTHRPGHLVTIGIALSLAAGCAGRQERAPRPTRGYITNIERATLLNEDFRRVLFTAQHTQLVLMTLNSGEEIGTETHPDVDQFIRVEAGTGRVVLNGEAHPIEDGTAVVIPAGVEHNVVNSGGSPMRLYVLYSPPQHPPGTVHRTKREAEAAGRGH